MMKVQVTIVETDLTDVKSINMEFDRVPCVGEGIVLSPKSYAKVVGVLNIDSKSANDVNHIIYAKPVEDIGELLHL